MQPLRNRKHELIALLVAADFEPVEACRYAGLSDAQPNVSRTINRPDIQARLRYLRGEADADAPPDLASDESIMAAVVRLANDPTTGDASRIRALELIRQIREDATYRPQPGEAFDANKLSPDQLAVCRLYHAHMTSGATQSPAAIILERLNALAESKNRAA